MDSVVIDELNVTPEFIVRLLYLFNSPISVFDDKVTSPSLPSPKYRCPNFGIAIFITNDWSTAVTPEPSVVAVPIKKASVGVTPVRFLSKLQDSASLPESLSSLT